LFEGTKNFWRTRENVDIRIIEHTDARALEVIAFSPERHEEADRIFLNADKVYKKLDNEELSEKITLKREELSRARKRVPNEEIKCGLLQELSVAYVLARLSPSTTTVSPKLHTFVLTPSENSEPIPEGDSTNEGDEDPSPPVTDSASSAAITTGSTEGVSSDTTTTGEGQTTAEETASVVTAAETKGSSSSEKAADPVKECEPRFHMEIVALTGDKTDPKTGIIDVLMREPPASDSIEYIIVTRPRRKASTKEFNQTLRLMRQDHHKLNKAMSTAQRKAGLAVSSVEGFQNFVSRSQYNPETMSIAQWRWVKSIRRVILQNAVAAYTRRLERYERENADKLDDGAVDGEAVNGRRSRIKSSNSTTKLPLLQKAKDISQTKRRSMDSMRRVARGSREPRQINDFSAAFSGGLKTRVDSHMNGTVLTSADMMSKYGMTPGLAASESAGILPNVR
jgi:hypothetical protein